MNTPPFTFFLPRRGNEPKEYEDAYAVKPATGRFAVADGATESGFAAIWANLLVQDFVHESSIGPDYWTERLPALQEQWRADVEKWRVETGGQPLAYHAKAKFQQGAFATFLGVALAPSGNNRLEWRAIAVGDACLFHTRGSQMFRAFPLAQSRAFNNHPKLVGSRAMPQGVRDQLSLYAAGFAEPGDRLWLMTDALAHWCLAAQEAGQGTEANAESRNPWLTMESLCRLPEPREPFASWIEGLRDAEDLQNDDVTLLVIFV